MDYLASLLCYNMLVVGKWPNDEQINLPSGHADPQFTITTLLSRHPKTALGFSFSWI